MHSHLCVEISLMEPLPADFFITPIYEEVSLLTPSSYGLPFRRPSPPEIVVGSLLFFPSFGHLFLVYLVVARPPAQVLISSLHNSPFFTALFVSDSSSPGYFLEIFSCPTYSLLTPLINNLFFEVYGFSPPRSDV